MSDPTPIETLAALVRHSSYASIADGMAALRQPLFDNAILFAHVDALAQIMPRLAAAIDKLVPVEETETPEEPAEG